MNTQNVLIRKAFALTLRSLRKRAGLSQERLALEGIDRSYVSDLERGRSDPKLSMLIRLAELIGISPTKFMAEVERNFIKLRERESRKG